MSEVAGFQFTDRPERRITDREEVKSVAFLITRGL